MVPTANRPTINTARIQSPSVFGERFVTSRAWGLMYSGLIGSVNGLISFLHHCFITFHKTSQILRIQPLRLRWSTHLLAAVCVLLSAPAHAQKLGASGTGVDDALQLPVCDRPMGTVTLVEDIRRINSSRFAVRTPRPQRSSRWVAGGVGSSTCPGPTSTPAKVASVSSTTTTGQLAPSLFTNLTGLTNLRQIAILASKEIFDGKRQVRPPQV